MRQRPFSYVLKLFAYIKSIRYYAQIKGYTSKILREEFSELSKMPSLWTRSYFVSTAGNVCSETIKKYVENQKKRY